MSTWNITSKYLSNKKKHQYKNKYTNPIYGNDKIFAYEILYKKMPL